MTDEHKDALRGLLEMEAIRLRLRIGLCRGLTMDDLQALLDDLEAAQETCPPREGASALHHEQLGQRAVAGTLASSLLP